MVAAHDSSILNVGEDEEFDQAVTGFSERYADQNEQDYQEFLKAIKSGRLEAVQGS